MATAQQGQQQPPQTPQQEEEKQGEGKGEGEGEPECGWCRWMKAGGCKSQFEVQQSLC